ncbi:MAG: class C sortase [Bacillota bacterium]|nr:class C sortase [Bacillota bacterium]
MKEEKYLQTEAEAKKKTKKKSKKKKKRKWPFVLIFLLGLAVLSYPIISRLYYRVEANNQITDFKAAREKLDPAEIERRMELARAFNESLTNEVTEDPYSEEEKAAGRAEYARMLELNEKIGHVQIPKIDTNIPIYAGTNEEVLQKGAGHLEGTSLPIGGNSSHTVITAHSGLPTARLFTDLNKLEIGDKFYIHNIEGVLAYQVDQILTIDPSNFQDLLIVPGHDYATLLTCTPIMINTHRLIVRGHRIDYIPAVEEQFIADNVAAFQYRYMFYIALAIIFILLIIIIAIRRKKKKVEKELKRLNKEKKAKEERQKIDQEVIDNFTKK